ncbi:MAG: quinolinate synthase NadA [Phycisphaerales bacterium]|nr:MAG: quinolinate synthase NadA [Phycisphaerales bacterium]
MLYQPPLPPQYQGLSIEALKLRVAERKRQLGSRLVILGHHYQEDDVIAFADFTGDSLKLSQLAAEQATCEFVVFCGVHFMAESADILTEDNVKVILPDLSAGCSMADMATLEQLEEAWEIVTGVTAARVIPITYVNSSADIKSFCGLHGGACCTSSNAARVLSWALDQGEKIMFLPDQHLGRNTAYAMGFPLDSMAVVDPNKPRLGLRDDGIRDARFFLWKGHCSVHTLFSPEQCDEIRRIDPEFRIIVHPECDWAVVQKADLSGSTEAIIRTVRQSPEGSKWAVGTEIHLVSRLAQEQAGKRVVRSLAGIQCLCTTMYRIDLPHLLYALDELAAGRVVNQVRVDDHTRRWSRVALQRMLSLPALRAAGS